MTVASLSRIAYLVVGALGAAAVSYAAETAYPTKPVRLIVPYPPGGSADPTGRAYATWLAGVLGTTFVVDNRPGASSTIGHNLGAKAVPDGYTLLLGSSAGLVVQPALGIKLGYDPHKDFAPVGLGAHVTFLLVVHPSVPAKTTRDLIDLGKAQPGKISFGSPGTGTPPHLGMELMKAMTGAQFIHVPYKGGGLATADLLGGRIQAVFGSIPQWHAHLAAGRVRALGIGHPVRVKSMPNVPTIAETLPGFDNTGWYGILGPAGMPTFVVTKLNAEMRAATANPGFVKYIEGLGLEPASGTPQELGEMIRTELARWTKVIKNAGIKPD